MPPRQADGKWHPGRQPGKLCPGRSACGIRHRQKRLLPRRGRSEEGGAKEGGDREVRGLSEARSSPGDPDVRWAAPSVTEVRACAARVGGVWAGTGGREARLRHRGPGRPRNGDEGRVLEECGNGLNLDLARQGLLGGGIGLGMDIGTRRDGGTEGTVKGGPKRAKVAHRSRHAEKLATKAAGACSAAERAPLPPNAMPRDASRQSPSERGVPSRSK